MGSGSVADGFHGLENSITLLYTSSTAEPCFVEDRTKNSSIDSVCLFSRLVVSLSHKLRGVYAITWITVYT
jgi:hypothetical protein